MPRIVRGQLALDVGERLKDLGTKLLRIHEYSGEARAREISTISSGIAAQLTHLNTLVKSCRAAKNSYPNFPALRRQIADAGDEVYEILGAVSDIWSHISEGGEDFMHYGNRLLELATKLRLVQFVTSEKASANG